VFRLNVAAHPDYANGYDSLGEALAGMGRTEEALAAYGRAIVLDPDGAAGASARQQLESLLASERPR
jgi:cytochrome c-type biogenesis protein CcmH/NrfG